MTGATPGAPDVALTLAARKQLVRLASGREIDGYTLNGSSPGPDTWSVNCTRCTCTAATRSCESYDIAFLANKPGLWMATATI